MDFDQDRLSKLGIEFNSDEEASAFSALIQEELEVRIGAEISKRCTDEQLKVFDSLLGIKEASEWLKNNVPDYRIIVKQKKAEIEKELVEYGKDIIRSKQDNGDKVPPQIDLSVSADNSVKRNDRVITAIYCPKCGKKLIKTSCGDESCGWNPYKSNLICAIKLDNSFVSEINKIKRQEKQNTEITIPDFLRHIPQQEDMEKETMEIKCILSGKHMKIESMKTRFLDPIWLTMLMTMLVQRLYIIMSENPLIKMIIRYILVTPELN